MNRLATQFSLTALLLVLAPLALGQQAAGGDAALEHFYPYVADGGGDRFYLFLSNAGTVGNRCDLTFHGDGWDGGRLVAHEGLSQSGTGAEIEFNGADTSLLIRGAGEAARATGFAILRCDAPVAARMLLTSGEAGAITGMSLLDSAKRSASFQFPILQRLGAMGFALANDGDGDAVCAMKMAGNTGMDFEIGSLTVPANASVIEIMIVEVTIPEYSSVGPIYFTCDRKVAAAGMPFNGAAYTGFQATRLDAKDQGDSSHFIPLVADGDGFQSELIVTNLAEAANTCILEWRGEGLDSNVFENRRDMDVGDPGTAFELSGAGDQRNLRSLDGEDLAIGHAELDCAGPVSATTLLTLRAADADWRYPAMAAMPSSDAAAEFRFPLMPEGSSLALVFGNPQESDTTCRIMLRGFGGEASAAASIMIASHSTTAQFVDTLFAAHAVPAMPDGGMAEVSCGQPVHAISLPASGSAFAAIPPLIPSAWR